MSQGRLNRQMVVIAGLCSSLVATGALAERKIDPVRLKPVKLAPKQERAAPPPPLKAYAIDGTRFYLGGRRFVIEGLEAPRPGSELAKQRLQQILDSGELTVAPVGETSAGAVRARISIDGKLVSD